MTSPAFRPRSLGPCRILQLTTSSSIGGTERMTLELARGLDPARFEVVVASLDGPGAFTEACREAGLRASNWGVGRPIPWKLPWLRECVRRARDQEFDLVQTYGLQADLAGRFFKRQLGNPKLVCSIRSTDAWRSPLQVRLDRWTAGRVDLFIANSEAGRRSRIEREGFAPERILTIHSGIELDPPGVASREEARAALGLSERDFPVIAHVANLRPMKGHDEALEAAARLKERLPRAVWLFAGRDDSRGRYARRARERSVGDRVRFLGFHPRPREIARAADVAILPSHYEGLPAAILEAMAESRAIVASNVGGIPELVRHEREALLIPPGRPEALAEAIARLADDEPLRLVLSRAARRRAEAEFALPRMIRRYEEAYESLMTQRG
ncbi:MAG: glycosyltransferase [Candidatus Sumerlaeota bacterium]|nr:glycosyltransferase [Candidatus Sumerlaeota bacterium]